MIFLHFVVILHLVFNFTFSVKFYTQCVICAFVQFEIYVCGGDLRCFFMGQFCRKFTHLLSVTQNVCSVKKTSQELRMLSSVTINCQVTKIVMNSGSQLSVL